MDFSGDATLQGGIVVCRGGKQRGTRGNHSNERDMRSKPTEDVFMCRIMFFACGCCLILCHIITPLRAII